MQNGNCTTVRTATHTESGVVFWQKDMDSGSTLNLDPGADLLFYKWRPVSDILFGIS